MPDVSVIIPVYDVEQWLPACIDSVLAQTLQDYEVICVNDCSPDNCAAILAEYAARDSRIHVINLEKNGGQGIARNVGFEASTGRRPDVILGKPYAGIVEEALKRTGFGKGEMAMVGDRLYTDVATGVNHGLVGILVLSGETKREDLASSEVKPDLVFDRLSSMIPYL